jgi:anaerobic ribonucleoside-triphosphate reductase activating protein
MNEANDIIAVAQIVSVTEAEGPGRRFALWFQGCPLRCPGCCNPEMLPFEGGTIRRLAEVVDQMRDARMQAIEGITLLGGEPFAHADSAARLADAAHELDLSVMVFTGYLLEDLAASEDAAVRRLLDRVDILVDGPYIRELPERERRWIGSSNQRIHFLSPRCSADDPRWRQSNTLEVRLADGIVTVNGFPATQAVGLWRRPREARR